MSTKSDYLLQKDPQRAVIYKGNRIWWSRELKRWMVADVKILRQILNDDSYTVPDYDASAIIERLDIDLSHMTTLTRHMPLAVEGERHRKLRVKFAKEISKNTQSAILAFETVYTEHLDALQSLADGARFCLIDDLLQPSLRASLMHLAGIGECPVDRIELIPQLFDDTVSLRKRVQINSVIGAVVEALPGSMSTDEKYFRTAILALSGNTLLGSMSQSILNVVSRGRASRLSDLDWDLELPETGLALVEKYATRDTEIAGCPIKTGDRLRLFLDAAGYQDRDVSSYSDLFFGSGPHKCPGMSFSRQAWKVVSKQLSKVPRRLIILAAEYRKNDHVFNLHERIEANFCE